MFTSIQLPHTDGSVLWTSNFYRIDLLWWDRLLFTLGATNVHKLDRKYSSFIDTIKRKIQ